MEHNYSQEILDEARRAKLVEYLDKFGRILTPISTDELLRMRARLNLKADTILKAKGNDYNSAQVTTDQLFNIRVCALLGIVPSPIDGLLVRLSDKFMRIVSLTRPGVIQQVNDESLEDTIVDARNYQDYLLAMFKKLRGEEVA